MARTEVYFFLERKIDGCTETTTVFGVSRTILRTTPLVLFFPAAILIPQSSFLFSTVCLSLSYDNTKVMTYPVPRCDSSAKWFTGQHLLQPFIETDGSIVTLHDCDSISHRSFGYLFNARLSPCLVLNLYIEFSTLYQHPSKYFKHQATAPPLQLFCGSTI